LVGWAEENLLIKAETAGVASLSKPTSTIGHRHHNFHQMSILQPFGNMSTVGTLKRISASALAQKLGNEAERDKIAVIDVRDNGIYIIFSI
jgi:hypothetical protein